MHDCGHHTDDLSESNLVKVTRRGAFVQTATKFSPLVSGKLEYMSDDGECGLSCLLSVKSVPNDYHFFANTL